MKNRKAPEQTAEWWGDESPCVGCGGPPDHDPRECTDDPMDAEVILHGDDGSSTIATLGEIRHALEEDVAWKSIDCSGVCSVVGCGGVVFAGGLYCFRCLFGGG